MKNLFYRSLVIWMYLFHVPAFSVAVVYAEKVGTTVPRQALPDMIQRVQQSVVNIQTDRSYHLGYWGPPSFTGQFFSDFFEDKDVVDRKYKCKSEGSGVIIDPSGLILTNEHVIADAENIRVVFNNKKSVPAKLIGKNKKEDLALLQVESEETFPAVAEGDSDAVSAGEDVFAVGTPYGYSQTVTRGIVSATHRQLKDGDKVIFDDLIQTDAAINPGNSGGPLLNSKGEMIGIIHMEDRRARNIGFAIPINKIKGLIPELKTARQSSAALQSFKERFGFMAKEAKDSDGHEYVSITEVQPGSKARKMGLRAEDRLLKFEKKRIDNLEGLLEEAAKVSSGQRVYIEFGRQTEGEPRPRAGRETEGEPRPRAGREKRTFFTYLEVNP